MASTSSAATTSIDDIKIYSEIGRGAFSGCPSLVVPTVPEGTEVGARAFEGCLPASS